MKSQAPPDRQLLSWTRAFAQRQICEQRARLAAVRGDWAECVQQHIASIAVIDGQPVSAEPWQQHAVLGGLGTALPCIAELGGQIELASQLAALSHARLQQSGPTQRAALLDAQHAVALLASEDAAATLSEVAAALRSEAAGATSVHIGAVPCADLLSAAALDRVRQRNVPPHGLLLLLRRAVPVTVERLCCMVPLTALQARAHARLSLVAAVYQQLGLALRAAGQTAESQRAFAFADEIAAMRPAMRAEPRAQRMLK